MGFARAAEARRVCGAAKFTEEKDLGIQAILRSCRYLLMISYPIVRWFCLFMTLAARAAAQTPEPHSLQDSETAKLEQERTGIVSYLRKNMGEPYKLGAESAPLGFDCSGLVQRAYQSVGVQVPRVAEQQFETGVSVTISELKAGDLLFFRMGSGATRHLHVMIYVGDGRAIHASILHDAVREIELDRGPWPEDFLAARRLLKS